MKVLWNHVSGIYYCSAALSVYRIYIKYSDLESVEVTKQKENRENADEFDWTYVYHVMPNFCYAIQLATNIRLQLRRDVWLLV